MKFLAISDVHSQNNDKLYDYLTNNEIDLVIITGDLTDFGPLEFVDEFISKLLEFDCDVVAIPGNCDPKGICNAITESGALCIHNNVISYGDAVLFGYGGSNPTPFNTPGEIPDNEIYSDVCELIGSYNNLKNDEISKVKILVSHAPPFNTDADLISSGDHVGSQAILKIVHEFNPHINICGHIHEAKSLSKIGKTDVANPGMLKDNGAVLIDINNGSDYEINIISLDE